MKRILVLGAGKSATVLIRTLLEICATHGWQLTVGDQDLAAALEKLSKSNCGTALEINVEDPNSRAEAVQLADLVISLLPPSLHHLVALDCVREGKNMLTASYADETILALDSAIKAKNLLFLCEMGLDPGIDHMSAMKLIDEIRAKGGKITSFLSHCGGLVAPDSDDNPWHYKISWNPANVISAGKAGALFLENGRQIALGYDKIFEKCDEIFFPGLGQWMVYPNRDSIKYRSLYGLDDTHTFIRTTIRHPEFIRGWSALVKAGLTREEEVLTPWSLAKWATPLLPFINSGNKALFDYLGLLADVTIPPGEPDLQNNQSFNGNTSSRILQSILEHKLAMKKTDHDMILMLHELTYELNGKMHTVKSSFRLDGFDASYTAMATTVGLPLAHAAELILKGEITLTGVQLPIAREIYEKVLPMLAEDGIVFSEEHH